MLVQNLHNPFYHQYFHLSYFSHLLCVTLLGSVEDLDLNLVPNLARFTDLDPSMGPGRSIQPSENKGEIHVLKNSLNVGARTSFKES
jgi:hypothetical protein